MPTPLAKSAFGISYTDTHYKKLPMWHISMLVTQLPACAYDRLDEYQQFVTYANIQPGETVLDFACGTGFVGLLARDVLGIANARQVDFVDGSKPALQVLGFELKSRTAKNTPQHKTHWARDLRDPEMPAILKGMCGKSNGWNVVFAFLFIDQFTDDTKPLMIKRLGEYVAPGGRLVFDWPVPSPSHGLWRSTEILGCDAQRAMEAAIQLAGGTLQSSTISPDPETTTEDISDDLIRRAWANPALPGHPLPVNIDIERRKAVEEGGAIASQHAGDALGSVMSHGVCLELLAITYTRLLPIGFEMSSLDKNEQGVLSYQSGATDGQDPFMRILVDREQSGSEVVVAKPHELDALGGKNGETTDRDLVNEAGHESAPAPSQLTHRPAFPATGSVNAQHYPPSEMLRAPPGGYYGHAPPLSNFSQTADVYGQAYIPYGMPAQQRRYNFDYPRVANKEIPPASEPAPGQQAFAVMRAP
ncbi:hypothetical protein KC357_g9138 [Hortaea werneckii]|nr:hypothetical protein KC357_g9138 [Hortaea werneckii]